MMEPPPAAMLWMLIMGARIRTPRHLGVECALVLARIMAHVGGGAAHVEADELLVSRAARGARHADDAARRARQNGILAVESDAPGSSRPELCMKNSGTPGMSCATPST